MKDPVISEEKLLSLLPHGSGIDYNWEFTFFKNGNVKAKNYFHAMNEHGYYDGIMPFSVLIFRHKNDVLNSLHEGRLQIIHRKGDIDFLLICNDSARNSFYGLRDYLTDTIHHALHDFFPSRLEILDIRYTKNP